MCTACTRSWVPSPILPPRKSKRVVLYLKSFKVSDFDHFFAFYSFIKPPHLCVQLKRLWFSPVIIEFLDPARKGGNEGFSSVMMWALRKVSTNGQELSASGYRCLGRNESGPIEMGG
jgi:hypothetical protein